VETGTPNKISFDFETSDAAPVGQNYPLHGTASITDNTWYYSVVTFDTASSHTYTLYLNGAVDSSAAMTHPADYDPWAVGIGTSIAPVSGTPQTPVAKGFFKGTIDEVRISNTPRTAAWISTSYNSMNSPSTFMSFGSEETNGPPPFVFSMSNNGGITVAQGSSGSNTITATLVSGTAASVSLSCTSGLPSGASCGFNPLSGTPTFSSTLTVSTTALTPTGSSTITVTGTAGAQSQTTQFTLTVNTAPFDPWANGWTYRRSITVDHNKVSATLANFPVLIDITSTDLKSPKVRSDAYDILFMDGVGSANKLDHEIESYTSSTGHLVAWVRLPSLSSTVDKIFYIYYGNPSATNQQNKEGVWDSRFVMVQHLSETSGTHYDSTSHHNNGSPVGGVAQGVAGRIGGADSFDGVDDRIDVLHDNSLNFGTGDFTLSVWIKYTNCIDTDITRKGNMASSPEMSYKMEVMDNIISGPQSWRGRDCRDRYDLQ
jgi:hypothetical protein